MRVVLGLLGVEVFSLHLDRLDPPPPPPEPAGPPPEPGLTDDGAPPWQHIGGSGP